MLIFDDNPQQGTPIELVASIDLDDWLESQDEVTKKWAKQHQFEGKANQFFVLPNADGTPGKVFAGIGKKASVKSLGALAHRLPKQSYFLSNAADEDTYVLALGWGMGTYRYNVYRTKEKDKETTAKLYLDPMFKNINDELEAVNLSRDLINTPAGDMLPHNFELAVRKVCKQFEIDLNVTTGEELIEAGFRTIHAVGRASVSAPRLLDFSWGNADAPKVTLIGKGVCFDSGGLDLKTAAGMLDMKKDMGGAAIALGLAQLIMARQLNIRLRVLLPAVENAVSANAYHPRDVIHTYKGTTVEVGNTDAEGRLILCDAITLATEDDPELIIDFATLTGAARIALGPDLPALYCNRDEIADEILESSQTVEELVWRLPLFKSYRSMLDSKVADLSSTGSTPLGGSITAALFLEHFVNDTPWVHFDLMASNTRTRPAHPEGGEGSVLRTLFHYLHSRFGG